MLRQLFNSTMLAAFPDMAAGVDPVVNVSVHTEGRYAFVELRTAEMSTASLQLNGQVQLLGATLSIGRPSGYVDPGKAAAAATVAAEALAKFQVCCGRVGGCAVGGRAVTARCGRDQGEGRTPVPHGFIAEAGRQAGSSVGAGWLLSWPPGPAGWCWGMGRSGCWCVRRHPPRRRPAPAPGCPTLRGSVCQHSTI